MLKSAEFWVAVSFVIFVGVLIWQGVPGMITRALDDRAEQIRKELDQAQKLREEAQAMLGEYQKKHQDAEKEVESIIAHARKSAEDHAIEARKKLAEQLERRGKMAEDKIAQAETDAVKSVQAAAADMAIAAASKLLAAKASGSKGSKLIDDSISSLKNKLN